MTRKRIGRFLVLLIAGIVLSGVVTSSAANPNQAERFTIGGSLENNLIYYSLDKSSLLNPGNQLGLPELQKELKFQLSLDAPVAERASMHVKALYSQPSGFLEPAGEKWQVTRAFADLTLGEKISLRLGKQKLSWGTGYAWNPTDLFNVVKDPLKPTAETEGVNAIRLEAPVGPANISVVTAPEKTLAQSRWAGKVKTSLENIDLSISTYGGGAQRRSVGFDFAGSFKDVGLHGEILAARGSDLRQKEDPWYAKGVFGGDYAFTGGTYVALEYYHNEEGFATAGDYLAYLTADMAGLGSPAGATGLDALLGQANGAMKDYLFAQVTRPFGQYFTAEGTVLYNLKDYSSILAPTLKYSLNQNTTLALKGVVPGGEKGTEARLLPWKAIISAGVTMNF